MQPQGGQNTHPTPLHPPPPHHHRQPQSQQPCAAATPPCSLLVLSTHPPTHRARSLLRFEAQGQHASHHHRSSLPRRRRAVVYGWIAYGRWRPRWPPAAAGPRHLLLLLLLLLFCLAALLPAVLLLLLLDGRWLFVVHIGQVLLPDGRQELLPELHRLKVLRLLHTRAAGGGWGWGQHGFISPRAKLAPKIHKPSLPCPPAMPACLPACHAEQQAPVDSPLLPPSPATPPPHL